MTAGRAAAFLDRDGTIIRDTSYLNDPRDVELLPGAAPAIRRLNDRGVPVIVVTNQSGIARGLVTSQQYEDVKQALDDALAKAGARIDATYMCPHHPDFTGACPCRKPGLQLFEQAVADLGVDASRSAFIGDRWRDVEPGLLMGGRSWLVESASTPVAERDQAAARGVAIVRSLDEAVSAFMQRR